MPAAAIPLIISAVGTGYGIYSANKQQSQQQQAIDAQRASSQGIQAQQTGLANSLTGSALPATNKAIGYYSTLLNGSRGQMRLATAAARGAANDTYKGAERGAAARLTGGARDQAIGEMERDRAGAVSGLTTGVQPAAASALGSLSGGLLGTGNAALGNAGLTSANLLGSDIGQYNTSQAANANALKGFGGLMASLLNAYGKGGGGSSTGGLLPSQILAPRSTGYAPNVSPSGNMSDLGEY